MFSTRSVFLSLSQINKHYKKVFSKHSPHNRQANYKRQKCKTKQSGTSVPMKCQGTVKTDNTNFADDLGIGGIGTWS